MKATEAPVIIKQEFEASIEKVWKAITDINEMHKWYFDNIPDFKPEIGFRTEFNVQSEERNFLHQWVITEVIPNKSISYSWQFEEYSGKALVTFSLSESGSKTILTLTNEVLEDFPDDIPEFKRESCLGGWEYFINQRLTEYFKLKK